MIDYNTFHVVDHPLIKHKLSIMRAKETGSKTSRREPIICGRRRTERDLLPQRWK